VTDFADLRAGMVERQLRGRGIEDERVLAAMGEVSREDFVPRQLRNRAYDDSALPIHEEQTISQPWIVAAICQALALAGSELVLEVGTGSGYSAAVLALLAGEVISVERIEALADDARAALADLGLSNVEVIAADASGGLAGRAPFDAIAVHASAPALPPGLASQLAPGGRLVIPIAADGADVLTAYRRAGDEPELEEHVIGPCRFVPLIGREGF
jgi:protein-L-isoaspartate(D-aspartate) O-methyltransferase